MVGVQLGVCSEVAGGEIHPWMEKGGLVVGRHIHSYMCVHMHTHSYIHMYECSQCACVSCIPSRN